MVISQPVHQMQFQTVVGGLSFPTSLTYGEGTLFCAESGLPWDGEPYGGKVWAVDKNGDREQIAGGLNAPLNGLTWHEGALYAAEGGAPGRISKISLDGHRETVVDDLPAPGNYHVNTVAFGPDGRLYFGQGAMTNSGIIGLDAYELGWLRRLPHQHDLPGFDIELTGHNATTPDPLTENESVATGAFVPFGTTTEAGQQIKAQLPCTASVMRCNPDGSGLQLVAWGLRNPFGLGFLPDGRLLAVDQGADDRGSRPIGNAPDLLFQVHGGVWYGWPDFVGGQPVTSSEFRPERGEPPTFVLDHRNLPLPHPPLASFPTHTAATKFAVVPEDSHEWPGQLLVTLFGDERPLTAPAGRKVGRSVVRIDPADWSVHPVHTPPLNRPIDLCFDPESGDLLILEFGNFDMHATKGVEAKARTGRILRVQST